MKKNIQGSMFFIYVPFLLKWRGQVVFCRTVDQFVKSSLLIKLFVLILIKCINLYSHKKCHVDNSIEIDSAFTD